MGAILPLTGESASYGAQARQALELVAKEKNQSGGVAGKRLVFEYQDDKMAAPGATNAFNQFARSTHPPAIVGLMSSSAALAVAPRLSEEGMVAVSPTASAPSLSGIDPFFFRVWPPDGVEGQAMARAAFEQLGLRRLAVLAENNDYGETIRDVFSREFSRLGGEVVYSEAFRSDATEFRAILDKIIAADPEAVYVPGYYAPVAIILRQLRQRSETLTALGASPSEDPKLLELAGSSAEGFIFTSVTNQEDRSRSRKLSFQSRFQEEYHVEAGAAATFTYDAASVITKAIDAVGTRPEAIANFLRKMDPHPGITGTISFEENGDVNRDFELLRVQDGKFVTFQD